jgi:hypothetical protein
VEKQNKTSDEWAKMRTDKEKQNSRHKSKIILQVNRGGINKTRLREYQTFLLQNYTQTKAEARKQAQTL